MNLSLSLCSYNYQDISTKIIKLHQNSNKTFFRKRLDEKKEKQTNKQTKNCESDYTLQYLQSQKH